MRKPNINQITEWINEHSTEIIENLDQESIDVFLFLKKEFNNSNIIDNHLFQFVYRSFYRLDNAGLTDNLKEEYFIIMEKYKNRQHLEFKPILNQLHQFKNRKGQKTIQFSFTTKMFNMIDERMPIYDKYVAKMFNLSYPNNKDIDKKINTYLNHYQIIKEGYKEIYNKNLLMPIIDLFDKEFKENKLPILKKIDFIFWSAGKIKEKKQKLKKIMFDIGAEGGGITIEKVYKDNKPIYIYKHNEFDPTDEGLDIYNKYEFDTFEEAFQRLNNKYDWFYLHLEHINNEVKDYVWSELIKKLNEKAVSNKELYHKINDIQKVFGKELISTKINGKINWISKS